MDSPHCNPAQEKARRRRPKQRRFDAIITKAGLCRYKTAAHAGRVLKRKIAHFVIASTPPSFIW
jgi:hypothetical protein